MTEWKVVTGSQKERPLDIDRLSSPVTVYLRRNIEQVTRVDEESGTAITEWRYEEKQMSKEEYNSLLLTQMATEDMKALVLDTALNAEYTACLMELNTGM